MKKVLTSLLMVALCAGMGMAATPKSLVVNKTDGKTEAYAISNIGKLTFDTSASGSLKIYRVGKTTPTAYGYSGLKGLTFSEEETSIVEITVDNAGPTITYDTSMQMVEVASSINVTRVSVVDLGGRIVASVSPQANYASISLNDVNSGIYVVNAFTAEGCVTLKIVKR